MCRVSLLRRIPSLGVGVRALPVLVLTGAAGCAPLFESSDAVAAEGPLAVVRGHLDAFNRRDPEDMLSWVSPGVEWLNVLPSGETSVELRGRDMLRTYMSTYFEAQPDGRSEFEDEVVVGDLVAVRERAYWDAEGEERSQAALAVFQVGEGLIDRVWYYPASP